MVLEYQNANARLISEKDNLQKELDKLKLAGVTTLVDTAIAEGKIGADKKEHFITLGKTVGAESLKLTFDAMNAAVRPTAILAGGKTSSAASGRRLREMGGCTGSRTQTDAFWRPRTVQAPV